MGTESLELEADAPDASEIALARRRRKRSITIFIVVSVLNAGLLALLWSQLLTPAANQGDQPSITAQAAFNGPMVGKAAPNFTLPLLAANPGGTVSLSDFRGKALVLNVWQSSCDPCQREAPVLQTTWQRVEGQGIVFLGLDYQDSRSAALSFIQTHGITYTNVIDTSGSTAIDYGVANLPTTIFINRQGKIVGWHEGELTLQILAQGLQLLSR
jgi:cytochrome c biogenesis protein CcmG/thiol:disulfide interchange protein DsbE